MDNLSILLFVIAGVSLTVGSFYLIYSAFASKELRDYNAGKIPLPKQKVTCDIEDYDELQRRINKIKSELEDLERPDLTPCEYEFPDEENDEEGGLIVRR